jgi:hypothetical protein
MENVRVLLTFRIPQPLDKNTTNKTKKKQQFIDFSNSYNYITFRFIYFLIIITLKWSFSCGNTLFEIRDDNDFVEMKGGASFNSHKTRSMS